jgi:hypothetical protein
VVLGHDVVPIVLDELAVPFAAGLAVLI